MGAWVETILPSVAILRPIDTIVLVGVGIVTLIVVAPSMRVKMGGIK